jgi:hypothetical protein
MQKDLFEIYLGYGVYKSMTGAPPLFKCNCNVLGNSVGIEFVLTKGDAPETAVRQTLSFEHVSMVGYTDRITMKLVERKHLAPHC